MVEEDTEFITFDGDTISKSDYRDQIINQYIQANMDGMTKITDFSVGSEAYHISDVMAGLMLEHRELIDLNYRMSMIHTMEGEFLDNFGDPRGVHRRGSSPSTGTVTFTRLDSSSDEVIIIPDGLQISTTDAISFIVDANGESLVIERGVDSVTADVICELEGEYTNVLPGTITLVMGDLGNKVSVENGEMTGGADIETDDEYRARILDSPNYPPCGTLGWYENLCNELESVHDVYTMKGETALDSDIIIYFNPVDREDIVTRMDLNDYNEDNSIESTSNGRMTKARADLIELFSMKEYNVVHDDKEYHLARQEIVLEDTENISYLFGVVLETNYSLNMVKDSIIEKIEAFNNDAVIGIEFMPSSLALIIENEVEGVNLCKIASYDGTSYVELIEPIPVDTTEVFSIDLTDIEEKIQLLNFNVNIGG